MRKLVGFLASLCLVGLYTPQAISNDQSTFTPSRNFLVGYMTWSESEGRVRFELEDCWRVERDDERINKIFDFNGNSLYGVCTNATLALDPEMFGIDRKILNQVFYIPRDVEEPPSTWSFFDGEQVESFPVSTYYIYRFDGEIAGGKRNDQCIDTSVFGLEQLQNGLSYVLFFNSGTPYGTGMLGCRYKSYEQVGEF